MAAKALALVGASYVYRTTTLAVLGIMRQQAARRLTYSSGATLLKAHGLRLYVAICMGNGIGFAHLLPAGTHGSLSGFQGCKRPVVARLACAATLGGAIAH